MNDFKNKTEDFNAEELILQEELALSFFEVEELEKRYEMGWAPDRGQVKGSYSQRNGTTLEMMVEWQF